MSQIYTPFSESELIPQPERLEIAHKKGKLQIGIPKETKFQEKRICLTPDAVQTLTQQGHSIVVESGAGIDSHFTDHQYSEAGAEISYNTKEVFSQPVILKVEPPTFDEIDQMKENSILISAVQLVVQKKENLEKMAAKRITALGFEYIKDTHGQLSIVRLIGEIAGIATVLVASELLSNSNGGNGLLFGGIAGVRPTEVVILGAGTVGEYAARSALGLGVSVRIFDNSLSRLRRLQNLLGYRLSTSIIDPKELQKSLMRCDVAIGALRGIMRSPTVVTEEMVSKMKKGSVIIDLSIDTGGCFETSQPTTLENPTYIKDGVIHYCVNNITSRVSRTATKALSNYFIGFFRETDDFGSIDAMLSQSQMYREGVYMYKGRITHKQVAQWFDLPYRDINLLFI